MKSSYLYLVLALLLVPAALADDPYKPYLHKPSVPDAPKASLYGKYQTNLFPGAGTYTYDLEVPPGTNGLQPSLSLSYNSQAMKQRPSILGAGWQLSQSYVYRDINFTRDNTTDDGFILVLNGASYDLKHDASDGFFHTEIETFSRVQNLTGAQNSLGAYWLVTLKDGTALRFGYTADTELITNTGGGYAVKWSLEQVEDTHANTITYGYQEDPHTEDNGSVYLSNITYNNDGKRLIRLEYEDQARPDRRRTYEQGNHVEVSRRLANVTVLFDGSVIRLYLFNYSTLNPEGSFSALSGIQYLGNDSSSVLHTVSFAYELAEQSYFNATGFAPSEAFTDGSGNDLGIRLVDVNNDGWVDMLKGAGGTRTAWLNNGSGWSENSTWAPPDDFVSSSWKDEGVRLVDVDADGFVDLVKGKGAVLKAWLNNGAGWSEDILTWPPPIDIVDVANGDKGVRFVDVNGDGRTDLVRNENGNADTYLNTPNGWNAADPVWDAPQAIVDAAQDDKGVRFADLNGDGLVDVLKAHGSTAAAWINTGHGWVVAGDEWLAPVTFLTSTQPDKGTRFADLNGDGLTDIIADFANTTTTERGAWINNGTGWYQSNSWQSPEPFTQSGKNVGRRLADVDGDGFTDIVIGTSSDKRTVLRGHTLPYLLRNITNEFGGVTTVGYETSTSFDNTGDDGLSDIGFNVWVVRNVTQDNGLSNSFQVVGNTSYTYKGGLYDHNDSEFRGFNQVNETLSDGSLVKHFFHQGDALKGKEFRTETWDADGSLLLRTERHYNATTVFEKGAYFIPMLKGMSTFLFDGLPTARVTNTSYSYDSYGNVIEKVSHGMVDVEGDEKYERYEFAVNVSAWILDRVSWYQLFGADNATRVRETRYHYDGKEYGDAPSKGDVTKIVEYLNDKGGPTTRFEYDSYGNLIRQEDSLGRITTFSFGLRDDTYTFVDRVSNALGHATSYVYDVATGNVLSETKNGITKTFQYDVFSRIEKEVLPGDSADLPTKTYNYSFEGVAPERIRVSQKTTANKTLDTYYYYSGFANLVQIKTPASANRQVVKNIFYDGLFRVAKEQNPYFASFSGGLEMPSSSEPKTLYEYDGLSRITKVTNPDGTTKQTSYEAWEITDEDENSHPKTYMLDGYERIIAVTEHNTDFYIGDNQSYNTTYTYNAADELVGIRDEEGDTFNFTFDALGRKIQLDDPDLGRWTYAYDLAGNLVKQTDNKGNEVLLSYDELNRILQKNTSDQVISFAYDKQYQGTLANISFESSASWAINSSFEYEYDDRLRVIRETAHQSGETDITGRTYDSMDRLLESLEANNLDLDFYYGAQGRIDKIRGYINDTEYNAFGNPLNRSYFNNKVTSFSYNSDDARLNQIKTDAIQELNYSYDSVGNVIAIDDGPNSRNYRMSYDNLDRLTNVTIGEFAWVYSFDPVGNILKIVRNFSETTSFKFASGLAHAPSKVVVTPSGADVLRQGGFNSSSKEKVFEFFLVNEKNATILEANWTAEFGDGSLVRSTQDFNLTKGENVLVLVEHSYSSGGDYRINLTGLSEATQTDYETLELLFGAKAEGISHLRQNATMIVSEFSISNRDNNRSLNWGWNCSNGVVSSQPFNMSADEEAFVIIEHNYTINDSALVCSVNSSDGNQSTVRAISYTGVKIEGYNSSRVDTDSVQVDFTIKNYHSAQDVEWNITADGLLVASGSPTTLEQGQELAVSEQLDFTRGGLKTITVNAFSPNFVDSYEERYDVEWLAVQEFFNTIKNGTARVIDFFVKNLNTVLTDTTWNTTQPVLGDNITLGSNESILVIIEEDYGQGDKEHTITVLNGTQEERQVLDVFKIRHIEIEEFETLDESDKSAVVQALVKNNVANKTLSWQLNNTQELISSSERLHLDQDEQLFVIIENSFNDDGVYRLNFHINSSNLNDNITGIAVS